MRPENTIYRDMPDGHYHVGVRVSATIHDEMIKSMRRQNMNRTEWLRDAILEKLAFEKVEDEIPK